MGGAIFENETELIYDSKQASLFIQINKPLFRQGQLGESLFRQGQLGESLLRQGQLGESSA